MVHILVSACLAGERCKWDGTDNRNGKLLSFMERLAGQAEFHFVCPEQLGGLLTPRPASEIRKEDETVVNTEGRDVTAEFLMGADLARREAEKYGCRYAVLKERSPSCGSTEIYDGTFSHTVIPGKGKTAALLEADGLAVYGEDAFDELERRLEEAGLIVGDGSGEGGFRGTGLKKDSLGRRRKKRKERIT